METETIYEIRVKGVLDSSWSMWFEPMKMVPQYDETLLVGPLQDQSELFGILLKIRDMGISLISVNLLSSRR